jgi:hypothetical protein
MFKKIGSINNDNNFTKLKKQTEFATRPTETDWYGIQYYNVESPHIAALYNLIPQEARQYFYASLLVINDNIPPHTDIVDTTCLNCYITPRGYTTNFYDSTKDAVGVEFADQKDGHYYDKSNLIFKGSFTANPHEIYIFDNKTIHEVVIDSIVKPTREVLQLATNRYSYNELCEMLK